MKSINFSAEKAFKLSLSILTPLSWMVGGLIYFQPNYKYWLFELSPLSCPLYTWLAIKCPLCGLGHSLINAWTWDFSTSWKAHPLGIIAYTLTWTIFAGRIIKPNKLSEFAQAFRILLFCKITPTAWALILVSILITRNLG